MVEYTSETDRREFLNTIEPLTPFLFFCIDQLRGNPTEVHSVEEWKHLWRELPEHKKRMFEESLPQARDVYNQRYIGMDTPSAQYRRHRLNEAVPPHQPTLGMFASSSFCNALSTFISDLSHSSETNDGLGMSRRARDHFSGQGDRTSKNKRKTHQHRPPTPYNVFLRVRMKEERKQHPELTFVQLSSKLSKEWKLLSEKEQMYYSDIARNELYLVCYSHCIVKIV